MNKHKVFKEELRHFIPKILICSDGNKKLSVLVNVIEQSLEYVVYTNNEKVMTTNHFTQALEKYNELGE